MSEFKENIDVLWSGFINASQHGNIELAKKLIEQYEVEPNYDFNQAINVASMNKQDEMVKFLASFESVQVGAGGMTEEELIDLFIPGLDHEIDFSEDNIAYDKNFKNDMSVHYFRDNVDDWMPYDEAYKLFIRDVKADNNSRIWTAPGDGDDYDEDYINGFGNLPL